MSHSIATEKVDAGRHVVSVSGEIDLYNAPELKSELLAVVADSATEVIVDMTDTTFIDSTTLGVLISALKRIRTQDGSMSIVSSNSDITKIFTITGLDRVFTIYPSLDAALAAQPVTA